MRFYHSLAIFLLTALLTSCYSTPEPGVGIIIVKDYNQFRIPAAEITLEQSPGIPYQVGYTDQNGEYRYTFPHPDTDQPVEVILNVFAKKGSQNGQGMIRIKPGETTTTEILM